MFLSLEPRCDVPFCAGAVALSHAKMADFPHCSARVIIPKLAQIITLDLLGNIDSFLEMVGHLHMSAKYSVDDQTQIRCRIVQVGSYVFDVLSDFLPPMRIE